MSFVWFEVESCLKPSPGRLDQLLDEVDVHHRVVSKGDEKFECASLSGDR